MFKNHQPQNEPKRTQNEPNFSPKTSPPNPKQTQFSPAFHAIRFTLHKIRSPGSHPCFYCRRLINKLLTKKILSIPMSKIHFNTTLLSSNKKRFYWTLKSILELISHTVPYFVSSVKSHQPYSVLDYRTLAMSFTTKLKKKTPPCRYCPMTKYDFMLTS